MDNITYNNSDYVHLSDIQRDNDAALHQLQLEEQQMAEKQKVKSITISHGGSSNQYVQVHEKVRIFRETYPTGKIQTEIVSHDGGMVVMKASVYVDNELVSTGHAYEKEGAGFVNKTSYIENCETSCVGRALSIFNIGVLDSLASAQEVANAIKQQGKDPKVNSQDPF